ncbi:non-ribosomal peptide synthetase [Streptomyces nanshensis]|uniref:non-ribosomal peptide synthetase n=1 Tax=Streptomyces nanshensis TaxID=518642 RepID=UPI00085C480C|nr:non-ribosomal peptide synthetase [Streptomyces nanshensis]
MTTSVVDERPPADGELVLPAMFDAAAARFPDAVAVDVPPSADRGRRLITYRRLKTLADTVTGAVARTRSRAVPTAHARDVVAAILLPRTNELLYAAQLGVLSAGAAHLCLEPAFPDGQLDSVLTDSRAALVLTDADGERRLRGLGYTGEVLRVDRHLTRAPEPTPVPPGADALAYLIYTSGTTGRPKGVMIAHRGIAGLIGSDVAEFGLGPGDRVAQGSSSAYDSSVEETWMALASGATVVPMDDEVVRLGPDLVTWLRNERVTVLCPPPTLLRAMGCADPAGELPDLRLLYVGGEALPADVAEAWSAGRRMVNGYGPTECTVTCVRHDVVAGRRIAIGRPVPGMEAWVLGPDLEPVEPGRPGELCMTGDGLALGYLNEPEKTADRFPQHHRLGRIYRTGDLVHREADGTLVHHGRIDSQVKLRGYRIELEAVEAHLARCPGVREAACRVQGEGQTQTLAAHVVPEDHTRPPRYEALREQLAGSLPSYMVPAQFGLLATLPRSAGGKLRRDDLPPLGPSRTGFSGGRGRDASAPGPADDMTERIARAVSRVLGTEDVGPHEDFFTGLGGSSLQAALLITELRNDAATESLAVRDVYQARTVAALARRAAAPQAAPAAASGEQRHVDTGNAAVATLAQTAWLAVELTAASALACLTFFWLLPLVSDAVGLVPLLLLAPAALPVVRLLAAAPAVAVAAALKRLLVGEYVTETVGAWSGRAVRMWMVRQVVRVIPWRTIAGTEYQCVALRALGARIGERVHIHRGVNLTRGGWDLLDIGDDVTLGQDAAVRLMELENRRIVVGPVVLEDGATVDVRAGVGPGSRIGRGAWLTALSSLPAGGRLGAGEWADGVPARATGPAPAPPPPRESGGRRLSPRAHGAVTVLCQALLRSALALPYSLLFALLVRQFGFSYGGLLSALGNPGDSVRLLGWIALLSCAGLFSSVWLEALAARALGTVAPGVIDRWSLAYVRVWLKTGLVASAGNWLSGALLWPRWLRAAGMRVGADCEISTVIDVVPELVDIGDGSFLADGIYLGGPHVRQGSVALGRLGLGGGTFLGNHAVLPGGRRLPGDLLIGIATPGSRQEFRPGSSWFGHPPFELPRREVVAADRSVTHSPSAVRRVNRWLWELARFALPLAPLAAAEFWLLGLGTGGAQDGSLPAASLLLTAPAVTLACGLGLCAAVLALKWGLLGRVRPAARPLWSCWCSRWDFLYVAWRVVAGKPLTALEGTLLLPLFLRCTGMRIGRRVVLGEGFAQVVDPDMLDIGDEATVSAMFQAHTFEDRVLKIDRIRVGTRASLSENCVPLYGATIGAGAQVAPHSVVMKQEELLPGTRYEGVPVHRHSG